MVVFIALSNLQHILIDMDFLTENSIVRKLYPPIQWMIMPMFYMHVHEVILHRKPKLFLRLTLYLIAGLVTAAHILRFFILKNKISIAEMPDYFENGFLSMVRTKKSYRVQRWYMNVLVFFVVIVVIGLSSILSLIQFDIDHTWFVYSLFLLVSFVGYYMGYVGVYRSSRQKKSINTFNSVSGNSVNTYEKIHAYIIEERRYLDMDLNLSEIAEKFNISAGYLSQLINANSDQNFNDYINSLRIAASKKMLLEKQYENYTIESIGLECGFKSKSNFYAAFKKFTGQTPSAYAKSQ